MLIYTMSRDKSRKVSGDFVRKLLFKNAKLNLRAKRSTPMRIRTSDPMIKSHLLYQLSYGRIIKQIP